MNVELQANNVPEKYQQLTKTAAFKLVNIPKTSFYRDWIQTGKISISKDEKGKDYISIGELFRVFGFETVMRGIREAEKTSSVPNTDQIIQKADQEDPKTTQEKTDILVSLSEFMSLKINLAKVETELEQTRERLKEEYQRSEKFQNQYFQEVELSRRLLEDRGNNKAENRSFFSRILNIFNKK